MIKGPCKDCENRTITCHVVCRRYQDWKKEHEAAMEDLRRRKERPISTESLRKHWINLRYINRQRTKK